MALQTDAVQHHCYAIARQMRDHLRTLNMTFIVHHAGQHLESLSLAGQELLSHPAAESALKLLKTPLRNEHSAFLGLATWREHLVFGLASRRNAMALATLNIDEFDSLKSIRAQAWHMAWHAWNIMNLKNDPAFESHFKNGVVIPTYSDEAMAACNLRADVFSAIMCGLNGDKNAVHDLAFSRAEDSVARKPGHHPEHYPFALAVEATQCAFSDLMRRPPSKRRQIPAALGIAENIGREYDDVALQQWIYFAKPAQDMAWRGDAPDLIIGASVSTSPDTYIRATGFLVSEILNIKPASILDVQQSFSPFAEDRYNKNLHETMIERAFQTAINAGMTHANGRPFADAANQQNQKMLDGHILGWCAAALQAAGRAFENALANGNKSPDLAARREFDSTREKTTWDSLRNLGETIVEHYRQGQVVTFSDIIDFCGSTPALAGVSSSLAFTMKDPSYLKKLDVANDLAPAGPAPAPVAAPSAPAPVFRAPAPGMGGGGGGMVAQTRPPPAHTSSDEKQE